MDLSSFELELCDKSTKYHLLATLILLLIAGTALWMMGQPLWGGGTIPGVWTSDPTSPVTSQLLTDPYTFTHVSHGILLYLGLLIFAGNTLGSGFRFITAIALESGWEILENTPWVIERFREATQAQGYYGDSILNSTGDILAAILGYGIAVKVSKRYSLLVFILLEITLLLWIRDNLLLNILMLFYPIQTLQTWQMAG